MKSFQEIEKTGLQAFINGRTATAPRSREPRNKC